MLCWLVSASGFEPCTARSGGVRRRPATATPPRRSARRGRSPRRPVRPRARPPRRVRSRPGPATPPRRSSGGDVLLDGRSGLVRVRPGGFVRGRDREHRLDARPAGTFTARQASARERLPGSVRGRDRQHRLDALSGGDVLLDGRSGCGAPAGPFAAGDLEQHRLDALSRPGTFSSTAGQASCASALVVRGADRQHRLDALYWAGTFSSTAGQASCKLPPARQASSSPAAWCRQRRRRALRAATSRTPADLGATPAGIGFFVPSRARSDTACPLGQTTTALGATSCVTTISVLISQVQGLAQVRASMTKRRRSRRTSTRTTRSCLQRPETNFIGLVKVQNGKKAHERAGGNVHYRGADGPRPRPPCQFPRPAKATGRPATAGLRSSSMLYNYLGTCRSTEITRWTLTMNEAESLPRAQASCRNSMSSASLLSQLANTRGQHRVCFRGIPVAPDPSSHTVCAPRLPL